MKNAVKENFASTQIKLPLVLMRGHFVWTLLMHHQLLPLRLVFARVAKAHISFASSAISVIPRMVVNAIQPRPLDPVNHLMKLMNSLNSVKSAHTLLDVQPIEKETRNPH